VKEKTMAFRPYESFIRGELDNRTKGKVTGWLEFRGIGRVEMDLRGDFHADIAGCVIALKGRNSGDDDFQYFNKVQKGEVGDITAGLPPQPYTPYPYIEWHNEFGWRVVLELSPGDVTIVSGPWWKPAKGHTAKVSTQSQKAFQGFVGKLQQATGVPVVNPMSKKRHRDN
jgi:hypothetical protein